MKIKFSGRKLVGPLISLVCLGAIATIQTRQLAKLDKAKISQVTAAQKRTLREEEQQLRARLNMVHQSPALGFNNLVANWAFLGFLQYFGDDPARNATGYTLAPDFFKIVISRDPRFIDIYPYLSSSITLFAGQPEASVALIEKGLKSMSPKTHPDSFYVWRAKGTDELLFLDRAKAAQHSFEMAAAWAKQSSKPEAPLVAENSLRTAEFLKRNPVSKRAKAGAWANIFTSAIDDNTRRRAVDAIRALGGNVTIEGQGQLSISMPRED
jgi:hypothetical protein